MESENYKFDGKSFIFSKGMSFTFVKPKMQDLPRFPNLTNPLENESKNVFKIEMDKALVDVTKKMVEITQNL